MSAEDEDPREESIKVCCRFRPQNQIERENSGKICFEVPPGGTSVYVPSSDHTFVFDRVFRWDANQKEVYDYSAKPIINAVLRGFNGTVFAYGQTSSGKTYTMEGPNIEDKVYQGVIPRMVWSIFDGIYHADDHIEFLVKVSIVEIYNERIKDLLDPKKDNLLVREDKARGVFIGEVTETYVGSEQEIFDAMRAGQYNRSMAVTNMNEHSSRSHLIFMLTVEQKNLHDRSVKVGKLHLVDLAGSEKVAKTGASGERLDEAKNINRSLSALGNVINALTDRKYTHVPYRDSKLTRVLQESLGGNAKTSLIVTCSPSNFNEQETISTLRFGQRAKMIKNVVKVNHERSVEELKLLLEKRDQVIGELRGRLAAMEQLLVTNGLAVPEDVKVVKDLAQVATASGRWPAPSSGESGLRLRPESDPELTDLMETLAAKEDRLTELQQELDTLKKTYERGDLLETEKQLMQEENEMLKSQLQEVENQLEYDRIERTEEVERIRQEKVTLQREFEALHLSHQKLLQSAGATERELTSNRPLVESVLSGGSSGEQTELVQTELERLREADRPLKRKVSQLDKNLEQLTLMYHKLVAQNSGLKVEVSENDKKIQRKDQRINQLERNLREAKQKYEKLLTQCANLTAAMDVMGRQRGSFAAPAATSAGAAGQRAKILRPVRGGVAGRQDALDGQATPISSPLADSSPADSPTSSRSRRDGSRTLL